MAGDIAAPRLFMKEGRGGGVNAPLDPLSCALKCSFNSVINLKFTKRKNSYNNKMWKKEWGTLIESGTQSFICMCHIGLLENFGYF